MLKCVLLLIIIITIIIIIIINIIRCNMTSIITGLWMVWYITGSLWAQENLEEAFIWTLFLQAWWKFLGTYWSSTTVTGYLNLVAEIYNSYLQKLNLLLTKSLNSAGRKSEIVLILIYPQLFYCYQYNCLFKARFMIPARIFFIFFMIRIPIIISVSISH